MMPVYIAMLRGINVSGHKIVRMEDLRKSCAALGLRSIETYVQSGNVVFMAEEKSSLALSRSIGQAVLHDFGFPVPVVVRTLEEMRGVVNGNPFLKERGIDQTKLHVTFLTEAASKDALKNLGALPTKPDRFHVLRQQIYLYCPGGYGRTKLSNTAFEKALSVGATTRNWNTVTTLLAMASRLR